MLVAYAFCAHCLRLSRQYTREKERLSIFEESLFKELYPKDGDSKLIDTVEVRQRCGRPRVETSPDECRHLEAVAGGGDEADDPTIGRS